MDDHGDAVACIDQVGRPRVLVQHHAAMVGASGLPDRLLRGDELKVVGVAAGSCASIRRTAQRRPALLRFALWLTRSLTPLVPKTGKADTDARIGFASPELLWQVLNPKRWELLKAMRGAGPLSIRDVARRVERDVKAVHGGVSDLLDAGVLNHGANSGVEFPFDGVRVEFMLQAAGAHRLPCAQTSPNLRQRG